MCGGYQILIDVDQLQCVYGGANWRAGHAERFTSRSSVRPTTFAPVLVRGAPTDHGNGEVEIAMMRWGLVPCWSGRKEMNKVSALINARGETITEVPSFAGALNARISRRCVVVSTGFYEWEKGPAKRSRKTPYLVRQRDNGGVLLLAGVYDVWTKADGSLLYSFAICTTAASQQFSWLHHRLPCILETSEDVAVWLDVCGVSGRAAASRVLRTALSTLVWTQMSADLSVEVGKASSRAGVPDLKTYFTRKVGEEGENTSFPKGLVERGRHDKSRGLGKLSKLGTPIKKQGVVGSSGSGSPGGESRRRAVLKSSAKKSGKGQQSIKWFFGKKTASG